MHCVATIDERFLKMMVLLLATSDCEQAGGTQAASSASKLKAVSASSKELVQLCTLASYADTQKVGQFLHTRPARDSLKKLTCPRGEFDGPTHKRQRDQNV